MNTPRLTRALVCAGIWLAVGTPVAAAAPPPNDNYLSPITIDNVEFTATVDTSEATVQSDLFNPDKSGQPFAGGGTELTTCAGIPYGHTVWWEVKPSSYGYVNLNTAGFDAVLAVYTADDAGRIAAPNGCANEGGVADHIGFYVSPGWHYLFQVGGVGDAAGLLTFKFSDAKDSDADDVSDRTDECPDTPGIPAYAGCPPVLRVSPVLTFRQVSGGVRLKRVSLDHVPRNARIVAKCRRCHVNQTIRATRAGLNNLKRFKGRFAPEGATIEVVITHSGRNTDSGNYIYGATGSRLRWHVKRGTIGTVERKCLEVNTNKVIRCA